MRETDKHNAGRVLETYFEAARKECRAPSSELMARILADAADVQAGFPVGRASGVRVGGFVRQLVQGLGGWPAVAGLAAATVTGLWIGMSQSSALIAYATYDEPDEALYLVDLSADALLELEEGAL